MCRCLTSRDTSLLLRVKIVPGASKDTIAGLLGDRLKIRISAPPEGGKANEAIRRLLAKTLGIRQGQVHITSGRASQEKLIRIDDLSIEQAMSALGLDI